MLDASKVNVIPPVERNATMNPNFAFNRRRALKTIFCSSAALALQLRDRNAFAQVADDATHLLAIGDFGTTGEYQRKVAAAMRSFVAEHKISPEAMMMLGDNFYGEVKDGFSIDSERWRTVIEDMYPASDFPGNFWAILGNHDYHDNIDGEMVQLAYAKRGNTRFKMPAKWYRFEVGNPQPLVSIFAIDTNFREISGRKPRPGATSLGYLSKEETAEQLKWLDEELSKPRAPFTIVIGHHPLYSNGSHGDSGTLIKQLGPLLERHQVHMYLCGHDHDLQHLELESRFTSFVISGGGGARTRRLKNDRVVPFANDVYGFTHLQVKADALTITHHGDDGVALHRFIKYPDGVVQSKA
jgi:tartrate-resistant acid phosphatase type 5